MFIARFNLIRDSKNRKGDDVIEIYHAAKPSHYKVLFYDRLSPIETYKFSMVFSRRELFQYVENMFELMRIDDEPFSEVQFTPQILPAIIVKNDFDLYRRSRQGLIFRVLAQCLNTDVDVSTVPNKRSTAIYDQE